MRCRTEEDALSTSVTKRSQRTLKSMLYKPIKCEMQDARCKMRPALNVPIVGSKWVFCVKKDAAGNVVCYKAQLVTQAFSQVPGVDYFNTFAPVTCLASICAVLAMAAVHDLELHQVNIKGAYLNGKLTNDEVIYMKQPPDYPASNSKGQVCWLLKTLYGLKQSGRQWYQCFVEILVEFLGFLHCEVDQAVFYNVSALC